MWRVLEQVLGWLVALAQADALRLCTTCRRLARRACLAHKTWSDIGPDCVQVARTLQHVCFGAGLGHGTWEGDRTLRFGTGLSLDVQATLVVPRRMFYLVYLWRPSHARRPAFVHTSSVAVTLNTRRRDMRAELERLAQALSANACKARHGWQTDREEDGTNR